MRVCFVWFHAVVILFLTGSAKEQRLAEKMHGSWKGVLSVSRKGRKGAKTQSLLMALSKLSVSQKQ